MSTRRKAVILVQSAVLATACSLPVYAAPAAQQQQLKPVLQAIDPSKAQEAPIEPEQQAQQSAAPNQSMEQYIPEFGKPDPNVPPSMAQPIPPGPGFASGYAPAQQPAMDTLQAPNAPDDPRLARLEQVVFGSTYPEHDTDDRLEHLEREAFSKVFPGDAESRIQRLQAKYGGPQGAFSATPGGRTAYQQPVTTQTQYRPQPPQYQPQNWQQPPQAQIPAYVPQNRPMGQPPAQQQAYQPAQQQPPPGVPAQPYQQPQQGYSPQQAQQQQAQQQQAQQQQAYQPPPGIPAQPYQPSQQAYRPPQQQPAGIPPQPYQPPQQQTYQPPQQQPPGIPAQPYQPSQQQQSAGIPPQPYQPPQQQTYQPPQQQPPGVPAQSYQQPQQGYSPQQQSAGVPAQPYQPSQQQQPASIPAQPYQPSQQQQPAGVPAQPYQPSQQQQPAGIPAQPYQPPRQQMPPYSADNSTPPSIPQGPVTMSSFNRSQPYQPPQQPAYQPPQQQPGIPGQPSQQQMPPYPVANSTPPSIPQGPVTMSSFNRSQRQPPQQQAALPQQQAAVPQQPPPQAQPQNAAPQVPMNNGIASALQNMPYDKKAGDYSQQITRLGGSFARWTNLPVRVHIPMNTPENWRAAIDTAVKKWSQYLPTVIAPPSEPADIEIGWINHLMPRQLGITNLEIFNGHPRVTVYLLRPSYYPPDVPEASLQRVALHEIGHALGLFGHSSTPGDAMFALDTPAKAAASKNPTISQRDVNTLRRIYEAAPLPEGFQSPQPISWP